MLWPQRGRWPLLGSDIAPPAGPQEERAVPPHPGRGRPPWTRRACSRQAAELSGGCPPPRGPQDQWKERAAFAHPMCNRVHIISSPWSLLISSVKWVSGYQYPPQRTAGLQAPMWVWPVNCTCRSVLCWGQTELVIALGDGRVLPPHQAACPLRRGPEDDFPASGAHSARTVSRRHQNRAKDHELVLPPSGGQTPASVLCPWRCGVVGVRGSRHFAPLHPSVGGTLSLWRRRG